MSAFTKGDRVAVVESFTIWTVVEDQAGDMVTVQYRADLPPRVKHVSEVRTLRRAVADAWALVHVISREVDQDSLNAASDALRQALDEYDAALAATDSAVAQGVPS